MVVTNMTPSSNEDSARFFGAVFGTKSPEVPEYFVDDEIVGALLKHENVPSLEIETLSAIKLESPKILFPLCFGLLMKIRSAIRRVEKRTKYIPPQDSTSLMNNYVSRFYLLILYYTTEKEKLVRNWNAPELHEICDEIVTKSINLSVKLGKEFILQPLEAVPCDSSVQIGKIIISKSFLEGVKAYHAVVQRPEGTFDLVVSDRIQSLAELPRQPCKGCSVNRQIYCGPCGGLRMPNAEDKLPERVELPFDVLLIMHW